MEMDREEAELIVLGRAKFTLPEHAAHVGGQPCYSDDAVRAAVAILDKALLDQAPTVEVLEEMAKEGLRPFIEQAVLAEREACAQIAEGMKHPRFSGGGIAHDTHDLTCESVAAAIRNRTPKEPK